MRFRKQEAMPDDKAALLSRRSILAAGGLAALLAACGGSRTALPPVEPTTPTLPPIPETTTTTVEEVSEILIKQEYVQEEDFNPEFGPGQKVGKVTVNISGSGKRKDKSQIVHPWYADSRTPQQIRDRVPMDPEDPLLLNGFLWPRDTHYPGKNDGVINPEDPTTVNFVYPTIVFSHRSKVLTGDTVNGSTAMWDIDKILTHTHEVAGDMLTVELPTGSARYEAINRLVIAINDPAYDSFIGDPRPVETIILGACGPEPGQISHRVFVEYRRIS